MDKLTDQSSDSITITNAHGRRKFIRIGAGFVLSASASSVLANDCDRRLAENEQKLPDTAGNSSDSDSGENADRPGCGVRYKDKPKISQYKLQQGGDRMVKVKKYSV